MQFWADDLKQSEGMATADSESPVRVGMKCTFDATFKVKVVACAESTTNRGMADKFFLDKSVREWREQKDGLLELPDKKKRMHEEGQYWTRQDPLIH